MEDDELEKYLREEAEQYIPFDIDDVYLAYQDLKTAKEEFDRTDVMLVAAKKEVIDGEILQFVNSPAGVDLISPALWRLASLNCF